MAGILERVNQWLTQGIGPIARHDNEFVYPIILGAIAISLILALLWLVKSVWTFQFSIGQALEMLLIFGGLLLDLALVGLIWLGFITPFYQIPLTAPATSGNWLLLPAAPTYMLLAGLLHIIVCLLGIQFLIGLWMGGVGIVFGQRKVSEQAIRNVLGAFSSILFIYVAETSHWPAEFMVPVEVILALGVASILANLIINIRQPVGNDGKFRAQHLLFIVFFSAALTLIWQVHDIDLHDQFGPFSAQWNPQLYQLTIGACTLITALFAVSLLMRPTRINLKNAASVSALAASEGYLLFTLILVFLLWLSFATPVDQLPFGPPSPGASWGPIALEALYSGVAVLAHAIISLASALFIVAGVMVAQFGFSPRGAFYQFCVVVAIIATIIGWELQHWPLWIVLLAELFLVLVVPEMVVSACSAAAGRLYRGRFKSPLSLRRTNSVSSLVAEVLGLTLIAGILFFHITDSYLISLLGVYVGLLFIDRIIIYALGIWQPQDAPDGSLNPQRWMLTLPLILVITLLGSSGLFMPLGINYGLTQQVWLDAGLAAAAYMVFKPLIDLSTSSSNVLQRTLQEEEASEIKQAVIALGKIASSLPQPNLNLGQRNPLAAGVMSAAPQVAVDEGRGDARSLKALNQQKIRRLSLAISPLFVGAVVLYHLMVTSFGLGPLLDSSFVPVVFGLTSGVAGFLALLDTDDKESRILKAPRYTFGVLLLITLVVTGIAVLFAIVPGQTDQLQFVGQPPLSLLSNREFYLAVFHISSLEFLFLLTIGQLSYLYAVINFLLSGIRDQLSADDDGGWAELGDRLTQNGRYDDALTAYERSREQDDQNAGIWIRIGRALEVIGQREPDRLPEALEAYEMALDINATSAATWSDKGDVLNALERYPDALSAYERATALDATNVSAWIGKGRTSEALDQPEEAHEAYREVLTLDNKLAFVWRNDADLLYRSLKRYDQALRAADAALKVDPHSIRAWVIKADSLRALGKSDQAQVMYQRALMYQPSDEVSWFSRGRAFMGLDMYREAITAFDRALEYSPDDTETLQAKAEAVRKMNERAEVS